jgi:hypothetical protein
LSGFQMVLIESENRPQSRFRMLTVAHSCKMLKENSSLSITLSAKLFNPSDMYLEIKVC